MRALPPQNENMQRVQIEWVKNKIRLGVLRKDFLEEFTKKYNVSVPTLDNRIKSARDELEGEFEQNRIKYQAEAENDPEMAATMNNLKQSKKLIYDSISYIILKKQKKITINGEERMILDLDLRDAPYLRTLWEMNLIGLGEPTTVSKTEVKGSFSTHDIMEATIKLKQAVDNDRTRTINHT
jgi:hypothetical protein